MTPPQPTLPSSGCIYCGPNCTVRFGLCHCTCGGQTTIARWDNTRNGHREGFPKKFIHNHHRIEIRQDVSAEESFEVDGDICRRIPLTKGQWAIVDGTLFEKYNTNLWIAHWSNKTRSYYAMRQERVGDRVVKLWMHLEIIRLTREVTCKGDHKNGNTLDNRERNLRPANDTESARNRGRNRNNTSGFKGVSFNKEQQKWGAYIRVDGILKFLGYFDTPKEAYAAYCAAAKFYFGEFARLA